MVVDGKTLRPMTEKGIIVFEVSDDDGMIHMLWMDRDSNSAERKAPVDLILLPGDPKAHKLCFSLECSTFCARDKINISSNQSMRSAGQAIQASSE